MNRFAWEQVDHWLGPHEAMALMRPHTLEFVRAATPEGTRVIDLGGGPGVVSHQVAQIAGEVVYVDHNEERLLRARELCRHDENVEFVLGDALETLAVRGPFDVALLLHLLEHLDNPEESLREIRRHAARIVVEVPNLARDPLNHARLREKLPCWTDADHITEFTETSLERCLRSGGFQARALAAANGMLIAVADATA